MYTQRYTRIRDNMHVCTPDHPGSEYALLSSSSPFLSSEWKELVRGGGRCGIHRGSHTPPQNRRIPHPPPLSESKDFSPLHLSYPLRIRGHIWEGISSKSSYRRSPQNQRIPPYDIYDIYVIYVTSDICDIHMTYMPYMAYMAYMP